MLDDDERAGLRAACEQAIAWRDGVDAASPVPRMGYAAALAAFDAPTPERGEAVSRIVDDLARLAPPGLMGSVHPRFFGWVIGASHPAGVAADWLTSAWGQNAGGQVMAAASATETVAARWLLDVLDLPRDSGVGYVTGATMANFVGLAAARTALLGRLGWDVEADGLYGAPEVAVLIGADAHATVFSALRYLGFGERRVTRVATDSQGRMRPAALAEALAAATGPKLVVAQAGQINTGAIDPFPELIPLAREHAAWVHVDGAFGLWARACPATAPMAAGIELADSWATDGHKWLQVPYDCGYAIVRDAAVHRRAMGLDASYLPVAGDDERNPRDYVPELSRRARGFATWAVLRALGRRGIADMVARHCALARRMAARLAAEPGVVIENEVVLNQLIARFGDDDRATEALIAAVQADGTCMLGGADWRGRQVMRVSVIGWPTTEADIDASADAILAAWRRVRSGTA